MHKIYVVLAKHYDDFLVVKSFDDKSLAKKYKDFCNVQQDTPYDYYVAETDLVKKDEQ